jgi:glycerol-3-phosphate acyltransferase PlsY
MPWGIPYYLAIFVLVLIITKYPTLSYSLAFASFPFTAWLAYHEWELVAFSFLILVLPVVMYVPRMREMRAKAGSWRHVFLRRGLKDRF